MSKPKLDVRVYPIDEHPGSTKAFASVAVDDLIAIRGIRVVEGEKGLFVTMPQSLDMKTNKYHDIAFPINGELRKGINKAVLEEYKHMASLSPDKRGYDKPDMNAANGISTADVKFDIRVYPINDSHSSTKAFASISVDETIAIRGVRVIEGRNGGMFVAMPQSQDKEGKLHDIAFPINGELRKALNKAVVDEYVSSGKIKDRTSKLSEKLAEGAEKAISAGAQSMAASQKHKVGAI